MTITYILSINIFYFQDFESKALKEVLTLTSGIPSIVSVPELFDEDKVNRVLLMADSGEQSTTLKALYQSNHPSLEIARTIGESLGAFLARLHTATAGSKGEEIRRYFERNEEGRRIAFLVSYGRLLRVLGQTKESGSGAFNPPIPLRPDQLQQLSDLVSVMEDRIMKSSDVLAMGDFWPGNILVSLEPKLRCTVIDWELARPGIPGLEIGQFLAEMLTLRAFHPDAAPIVEGTVSSFLKAYRDGQVKNGASAEDLLDIAWDVATRCGTHMIVTTPQARWGTPERTREVAMEGLEYIFRGINEDQEWLGKTFIKDILL